MTHDMLLQHLRGRLMVELLNEEGRMTPPHRPDNRLRLYTGCLNPASPVMQMHSHVIRPTMISDSATSGHMS